MSKEFYKNKKVLVTGGTGMIGIPLVKKLLSFEAEVTVASLDSNKRAPEGCKFQNLDLRNLDNCLKVCDNKDIVFHLAGVKGSPAMTRSQPASFLTPTIMFSFNMLEAARRSKVDQFLITSSVGVYAQAEIFREDDVWSTFPSENDTFAGWAKRLCELQAKAYEIEYGWSKISIVRPTNIFGPYDNFDPKTAMVIPSLIKRIVDGENPLVVWGDGSAIRDFAYSDDVADAMLKVVSDEIFEPLNIGSGSGYSIKEIVETIVSYFDNSIDVKWDASMPQGDKKRIMDTSRAEKYGIKVKTPLKEAIFKTIDWYLANKDDNEVNKRYNSFREFS